MLISEDIPKLYTALAEWIACLSIILGHRQLLRHSRISTNFSIMTGILALLSVIQILCGMISNALWLAGMLVAVVTMFVFLYSMLRISRTTAGYILARAFMWAELTASLEWQLDRFYIPAKWESSIAVNLLFCMGAYAVMALLLILIERHRTSGNVDIAGIHISVSELIWVWVAAIFFFSMSNLSYVEISSPFRAAELQEIFNLRTIQDLAGFIMLELLYTQKMEMERREEISAISSVLQKQYMQFRQSQENIELVNEKYHDLKHHLQVLRMQSGREDYQNYIDEMEQEIRIYDMEYHTGNYVLDTILTDKSQKCLKNDIRISVVADGALLDQIHVTDLAAIFGNALDNAIEHELQIPDRERRMIHVCVSQKNQMVSILVENYFQGELRQEGEELLTTKADRQSHGYGVKSIRHAVSKYGGVMTVGLEENWFRLKILFARA